MYVCVCAARGEAVSLSGGVIHRGSIPLLSQPTAAAAAGRTYIPSRDCREGTCPRSRRQNRHRSANRVALTHPSGATRKPRRPIATVPSGHCLVATSPLLQPVNRTFIPVLIGRGGATEAAAAAEELSQPLGRPVTQRQPRQRSSQPERAAAAAERERRRAGERTAVSVCHRASLTHRHRVSPHDTRPAGRLTQSCRADCR